jgi:kynurenine formamidase
MYFPGFSLAAARFLIEERSAAGLGSDTPGLEPGSDSSFSVNRLVLSAGKLALECLAHLDQLPSLGATVCAFPLPLQGGSGSPASVIAFIP